MCVHKCPFPHSSSVARRRPVVGRLLRRGILEADANCVHRPLVGPELEVARARRGEDRLEEAGAADGVALGDGGEGALSPSLTHVV